MNIFALSDCPWTSARFHCDRHVVKMVLESAQMLSTVLDGPYKPTHRNHPCTRWVAESRSNAEWLWFLTDALNIEYRERFQSKKDHLSWTTIEPIWRKFDQLPDLGLTPFAQAMPDEYKQDDPVLAYRAYYHTKSNFAHWRNGKPNWWTL